MDIVNPTAGRFHGVWNLGTRQVVIAAAVVFLLLGGVLGYLVGGSSSTSSHLTVLTGNAYVGDLQASVTVGGWSYGISESVAWMDASGSFHDSGWPACLEPVGSTIKVRFGEVPVAGPSSSSGGIGLRTVVWIDCRGAVQVHQ